MKSFNLNNIGSDNGLLADCTKPGQILKVMI